MALSRDLNSDFAFLCKTGRGAVRVCIYGNAAQGIRGQVQFR